MSPPDWAAAPAERQPVAGTADQAARKRLPFCLWGDSVTEQPDAAVTAMNPRRSDVLLIELS